MLPSERRSAIMQLLIRNKHVIIPNIAFELGVCDRTIRRDITRLSINKPIYTKSGRYHGGVYIMDDYIISKTYLTPKEAEYIIRIVKNALTSSSEKLSSVEQNGFYKLMEDYL